MASPRAYGRSFVLRPRLGIGAACGVVAFLAAAALALSARLLFAWDIGIVVYLVLVWWMMARADHADLERRADEEDAGAVLVLVLTLLATVVSFGAIAAELHGMSEIKGTEKVWRLSLAALTILLSWAFAHTCFTIHYAHDFYSGEDDRRGLAFPGKAEPDYLDFAYFSFTIGAASQTSDVAIDAPRMRRFVLAHTILSFLFNTTVLALAINVGGSLV